MPVEIPVCLKAASPNWQRTSKEDSIRSGFISGRWNLRHLPLPFWTQPFGKGSRGNHGRVLALSKSAEESVANDSTEFVGAIRKMLQARACIKTSVSAADEILAREWSDRGISLELIEQAIMIGCIRKYVSWRNNQTRTIIASLKYFAPILEEVQTMKADPEYWAYLDIGSREWKTSGSKTAANPLRRTLRMQLRLALSCREESYENRVQLSRSSTKLPSSLSLLRRNHEEILFPLGLPSAEFLFMSRRCSLLLLR